MASAHETFSCSSAVCNRGFRALEYQEVSEEDDAGLGAKGARHGCWLGVGRHFGCFRLGLALSIQGVAEPLHTSSSMSKSRRHAHASRLFTTVKTDTRGACCQSEAIDGLMW